MTLEHRKNVSGKWQTPLGRGLRKGYKNDTPRPKEVALTLRN